MKVFVTVITSFLLTIVWQNVHAQTKEETEKWIVEKLNKTMSEKRTSCKDKRDGEWVYEYYTPVKFSIQEGQFIVNYKFNFDVKASGDIQKNWYTEHITLSVPIYSLSTISSLAMTKSNDKKDCYGTSSFLMINLTCACAKFYKPDASKGYYGARFNNAIFIFINGDEEPDLSSHLQSAINKLKTFYPAPKETF